MEFALLDTTKPQAVAQFIMSLYGFGEFSDWREDSEVELDPEGLLETLWSDRSAPRKRMAKLCWQLLVRNDSPEHFSQYFTLDQNWLSQQFVDCERILKPIQKRLRWVLAAFQERKKTDRFIGQGNWGEEWLLPKNQTAYVRKHLRRARPDLLEESSNYEDALRYYTPPYFEVLSKDENRDYVGELGEGLRTRVWIEDDRGNRYPLSQATAPFSQLPGTGFSWGYGGSGPSALSLSILADAVGGDLQLAQRLRIPFIEDVIMNITWMKNLRLSNRKVMKWLETKNIGPKELAEAEARVNTLKTHHGSQVAEHKQRLKEIEKMGGLRMQRFDIVPTDFESALYVDLMRMFERTGWVLHCNRCHQPVPCEKSPRGNRQRARWLAGRPIYHEWCFREHQRERKRSYWSERSKQSSFQAAERERARKRRKQ